MNIQHFIMKNFCMTRRNLLKMEINGNLNLLEFKKLRQELDESISISSINSLNLFKRFNIIINYTFPLLSFFFPLPYNLSVISLLNSISKLQTPGLLESI